MHQVLTYIDISAVSAGISPDSSFYLVAIANAGSGVGRIAGGYLTDRIGMCFSPHPVCHLLTFNLVFNTGAITVIAPTTFCTGLITFAWPFAKSEKQFTAIAALYGCVSSIDSFRSSFELDVH